MSFCVKANIDGHILTATTKTASEALAKAVEWQIAELPDVSISDGAKTYSITEFSSVVDAIPR